MNALKWLLLCGSLSVLQAETIYISGQQAPSESPANLSVLTQKLDRNHDALASIRGELELLRDEVGNLRSHLVQLEKKVSQASRLSQSMVQSKPIQSSQPPVSLSPEAEYNQAYQLLKLKYFAKAATSLEAFLKRHPKHALAPNAHYWLGEIALSVRQHRAAAQHFNDLIKQFPRSNKIPGARLKLAYMAIDQGKIGESMQLLKQLIEDYPKNSVSTLARHKLSMLQEQAKEM